MALVKRALSDMLGPLSPICDVMVNATNTVGVMGAGLAKAFAEFYPPEMLISYKAACVDQDGTPGKGVLQIGKLHIWKDRATQNIVINLPTKRDWRDPSDLNDVDISCQTLARYLKLHPFYTVAMPILGTGYGLLDINLVMPMLERNFGELPNIIHLCMRPDRLPVPPKYLVIVGSRKYKDYDRIDLGVAEALIEFGLSWNDFEAAVSGGAPGVDTIGCGLNDTKRGHPNVATAHGMKPIVCFADWDRFGASAGFLRNRTVADIGTHFVPFVGKKSVGTRMLVELVNKYNAEVDKKLVEIAENPGDLFSTPVTLPVRKQIHVCDISDVSD